MLAAWPRAGATRAARAAAARTSSSSLLQQLQHPRLGLGLALSSLRTLSFSSFSSTASSSITPLFPVLPDPAEPWSEDFKANKAEMDRLVSHLETVVEEVGLKCAGAVPYIHMLFLSQARFILIFVSNKNKQCLHSSFLHYPPFLPSLVLVLP